MMKSRHLLVAAAVAAIAAAAPASAQELVVNGGFETGSFAGWTQIGNTGFTGVAGTFSGVQPADGSFQGYFGAVGSLGGISQNIATITGRNYTIAFDLANLTSSASAIDLISFGSTTLQNINGSLAFPYTRYTYTAAATSALTTLSLQFRQDPSYFLLDNVSVTAAGVPEPATWATMLAGFGAMGLAIRRRARRAARIAYA